MEEASIGEEISEEQYLFGRVSAVAATDDRIYVLDAQVPVVRAYDHEGVHLLDIGRGGQGPAEFDRPTFMGLDELDNVYVHSRGEIEVFSGDGEHLATWSLKALREYPSTAVNFGGLRIAFVPVTLEREGIHPRTWKVGYTEIQEGVERDTRPLPEIDYKEPLIESVVRHEGGAAVAFVSPPFVPRRVWAISAQGSIVIGAGDRYRFEMHRADGTVMMIEKAWNPVRVDSSEAAWSRDLLQTSVAGSTELKGWDPDSSLPSHKPAFEQIVPDGSGRIWVFRAGPGIHLPGCNQNPTTAREFREEPCWIDSVLVDVFDDQGKYLGPVEIPEEFSGLHPAVIRPRPFLRDDIMIAAVEDELGVIRVKRYRLVLPGEE